MAPPSLTEVLRAAVAAVGGSERPGQVEMAAAVADAMETGQHLLVQAGTGTGKSLAYLVPALLHARAGSKPVVVATATIALQGQIVDRDLPTLVAAAEPLLGWRPSFAILKGRRNYVCRNRLYGGMPADEGEALFEASPTTALGRDLVRVRAWAEETASGDRDELTPGVSDRAWAQVSVTARECVGAAACPYGEECFAELARGAAGEADVVVTNHALLAVDAIQGLPVLPEHDVVVVDEGHELVDRVTGAATDELAPSAVERALRRCRRVVSDAEALALESAGAAFAAALEEAGEGRLDPLPPRLGSALTLVRDAARAVQSALVRDKDLAASGDGAGTGGRTLARAAVDAVFDTAERVVAGSSYDVAWVSNEPRRGPVLRVAPLAVAGLLRESLFRTRTVVLTSATLELGGSFDTVARSVGLAGEDAAPWRGLDVGSPFDYARQGILYVARHLPSPGRDSMSPAAIEELAELVEAAGGRTLGLFSSMRAAETAAQALRSRLDLPVLCQGEDATGELVRRFAASAPACLFGTMSLWQGVDVPGSSLQLVVIDRVPFPRPDDPLRSARAAAVDAAGGNGFMTVAAAHAALRLAQGSGRLIRSSSDRGVVAVLDSRLATARYAPFLRDSLPPFWFTTDRAQVRRSLAAIDASAPPPLPVRAVAPRRGTDPAAAPAAPAPAVAKEWTEFEDALLRRGVAAGRGLPQLADRHERPVEELLQRLEVLGLAPADRLFEVGP